MLIIKLIVIQVITFLGLVFVLRKIMYSASFDEIKRLQALSEENEKKSRELEEKMDVAQAQYKEIIEAANNESRRLKHQTETQVQKMTEEMVSKARSESERLLHQAAKARDQIRQEIEEEMGQKSMLHALGLIREVFSPEILLLLHKGLIEETIQGLEKIDPSSFQVDTDHGQLISAMPIEPAENQRIVAVLSQKIGRTITLDDFMERDLVAGVSIRLGSMVIDGSFSDKIRVASIQFKT